MQSPRFIAVVMALGFFLGAQAEQASNSPLHRAIEMLEKLRASITKDAEKQDAEFKVVSDWCRKGASDLKYEIKTGKMEVEDLSATISKADADMSTSSSKIEDEASSQSDTEAELKAAQGIRTQEHNAFVATESELQDSIDTLERSSNVLQRKMHGSEGSALVQTSVNRKDIKALLDTLSEVVNAAALSLHDKTKLVSLAQSSDEDESDVWDSGNENTQGSVLDLLEDLKQKAEKQLSELRSEEASARQNFEMVQASLTDEIKLASKNIAQAKDAKSVGTMAKATAEGDLSVSRADLKGDETSFANLDHSCVAKAADYDEAVKNRAEELQAVGAALKALSQSAGGASASFMEIQSSPDRYEVVNVLRRLAQQKKSTALAQLAGRVSTVMTQAGRRHQADPFKKVREMVANMVSRIEKEAKGDMSRKEYCDKEKKQSAEKTDELSYKMDKSTATSDKAKSKAASLNGEVAALQNDLANMAKQQADGSAIRQEEKNSYLALKSDLAEGLQGVRMALKLLHAQYGESANAGGAMKSVFSLLEIVEEDTSKSLANAEAEERASASEYEKLAKDSKLASHTKTESAKYKAKEAKSLAKTLTEYSSDIDGLSSEMDAVVDYAKNIRSECDQQPETYAVKKARRESEMEGLQEALTVLDGQTSLLQRAATPRHSFLRGVVTKLH